ncbi:MAG: hypothetical protein ACU0GG_13800 [Paracoccaceae bacterium]
MRTPEELCRTLMLADHEDAVVEILKEEGLWDDPRYWRYYGDDELNWNRAGNQQIRSDFALNEKLVNTIDSRLMLECMLQGIAPDAPEAPQSIREGVNRFIEKSFTGKLKVTGGRVEEWPTAYRTKIAQDLAVFVTGKSSRSLCVNVADLGEGQTPRAFPHTLLSLGKNNKIRVNFVQGKFGQGSTGALRFCGERRLQLIISKRHPDLIGNSVVSKDYPVDQSDGEWGFTIVRREGEGMNVRSPFYSYLAPIGADDEHRKGEVLHFSKDEFPIFPQGDNAYQREVTHGTLVKLYNYKLKGGSNILRRDGLRGKIDLLLTQPALPMRFHECRSRFSSDKEQSETMSGLFARLRNNKNLEDIKPASIAINVAGHDLTARIFAFKPGKSGTYRKSEGVIFTINGQTQGYMKASFFSRPRIGLQKIAKDLLVVLDCSAFSAIEQDDLFMPSRDRLVEDNDLASEIEKKLEEALKQHPGLRLLKNERATIETEEKLADNKPLEETINRVIKNSPQLSRIFGIGPRLPNAKRPDHVKPTEEPFNGKPHPSYFRFAGKEQDHELLRSVHLGRKSRIAFDTDAEDFYFDRKVDAGKLEIERITDAGASPVTNYVRYLSDGRCNVHLDLPADAKVGDVLSLRFTVSDPVLAEPFVCQAKLTVLAAADTDTGGKKKRKKPGEPDDGNVDGNTGIAMPKVKWIKQDSETWPTHFATVDDCLALYEEIDEVDGKTETRYEFFLNEANKAFQLEIRNSKLEPSAVKKQFEVGMVLIGLALIHDERQRKKAGPTDPDEAENDENTLQMRAAAFTRAIAPVILPMIQGLGDLTEDELDLSDLAGEVA